MVPKIPKTTQVSDANIKAKGPDNAKSRRASLLDGKDRIEVMHPNRPSWGDGSGIGMSVLIRRRFATR